MKKKSKKKGMNKKLKISLIVLGSIIGALVVLSILGLVLGIAIPFTNQDLDSTTASQGAGLLLAIDQKIENLSIGESTTLYMNLKFGSLFVDAEKDVIGFYLNSEDKIRKPWGLDGDLVWVSLDNPSDSERSITGIILEPGYNLITEEEEGLVLDSSPNQYVLTVLKLRDGIYFFLE